jgi:hypothetical protein
MGIKDHQRGERDGYSGTYHAPPASLDEAMGRADGEGRREFERQLSQRSAQGDQGAGLSWRFGLAAAALLLAWLFGVRLLVLAVLALAIGALLLAPRLQRLLRQAIAIYVGAAAGLCVSALTLLTSGAPLIADNLLIMPMLGAAIGLVVAVVRFALARAARSK